MATKAKALHAVCKVCGKPLTGITAQTSGVGGCCSKIVALRATGVTQWQYAIAMPTPPTGWLKMAQLHVICVANHTPVSHMVRASGSDRCMRPPMAQIATVVVVNGVRYCHPWLATKQGQLALQTYNFTNAPASNGL